MLSIKLEQQMPLSPQEQYDIINTALNMANDNGFFNNFIFERAFWGLVTQKLVEEAMDIDVISNPLQAWNSLIEQGFVTKLYNTYGISKITIITEEGTEQISVLDYFSDNASAIAQDYVNYLLSLGGALAQSDMLSTNNLENFSQQLQDFMNNDNTLKTLEIADSWGINNENNKPEFSEKIDKLPQDSLFKTV